jgi:hypothetical protein
MADEKVMFIRGADGALYVLSEDQLAKFKVADDGKKAVDDILDKAKEDFKAAKLSENVVKQIQQVQGCVKTIAESPEVYTNRKK